VRRLGPDRTAPAPLTVTREPPATTTIDELVRVPAPDTFELRKGAWISVPRVVGLDRAPAILAEARRRQPGLVLVLGEAHSLPFRPRAVERSVFVATLEFLERPAVALAEAVRVSRRGLLAVALNRWSPGASPGAGAPRPIGPCLRRRATSPCRPCARWRPEPQDSGSPSSAGPSVCSPTAWGAAVARVPLGDVVGVAVRLKP